MGHTQFIPTSYLNFAVDFTGDGKRNIWSDDPSDALASTAAYLKNGDLLEIAEPYPEPNTYYIRRERGAEQREVMDNFCAWLRQAAKSCGISAVN